MQSRTFETLFAELGAPLAAPPQPVGEAGLRDGVQAFFDGIVGYFETFVPAQRLQLIEVMASHPSLMCAAVVGGDPATPVGLRNAVILFILEDKSHDSLMRLNELEDRKLPASVCPGAWRCW